MFLIVANQGARPDLLSSTIMSIHILCSALLFSSLQAFYILRPSHCEQSAHIPGLISNFVSRFTCHLVLSSVFVSGLHRAG